MSSFKFKSSGIQSGDDQLSATIESNPIGVKMPISMGSGRSGLFEMSFAPDEQIGINFRDLLMTNHGERIGNFFYGANLLPLATEYGAQEDFDIAAVSRIKEAVRNFLPVVEPDEFSSTISTVESDPSGNTGVREVKIKVKYNIPQLNVVGKVIQASIFVV